MGDELDSGFVRQRRNSMLASLVLLFSETSELSITKLNVLGNELWIDKPQVVTYALWVAAIYWLWRFYQYSRPNAAATIRTTINTRVQEISRPSAVRVVLGIHPKFAQPFPELPHTKPTYTATEYAITAHERDYLEVKLRVTRAASAGGNAMSDGVGEQVIRITDRDLLILRVRAWFHALVHTRIFTDYMLPYVLFYVPVIYVLHKWALQR